MTWPGLAQVPRMAGAEVFEVGVQDAVDWALREMASQPHQNHVFIIFFSGLAEFESQDLVVWGLPQSRGAMPKEAPRATGGTGNEMGRSSATILMCPHVPDGIRCTCG